MSVKRIRTDGGRTWLGRAALAAGIALGVAACVPRYVALAPPIPDERYKDGGKPNPANPYLFSITEDAAGCPDGASMESGFQNCPDAPKDCVRMKGGQTVRFQSPSNDFFLQFDPFGKLTIDAGGSPVELPVQKNPKNGKSYTFTIGRKANACTGKIVDPQIILD